MAYYDGQIYLLNKHRHVLSDAELNWPAYCTRAKVNTTHANIHYPNIFQPPVEVWYSNIEYLVLESNGSAGRPQINVTAYVRDLERAKQDQAGIPDRHNLTAAKADLEKVLVVRPCLRTYLEMGQLRGVEG